MAFLSLAAPIGDPSAPKGGTFVVGLSGYPQHLLHYIAQDEYAKAVNELVLEPLLELSAKTNQPLSRLAERWEARRDQKEITFWIDPRAKFSDGEAVLASDVLFTWELLQRPESGMAAARSNFEMIASCEVLAPRTVRFAMKGPHFKNLGSFAEFFILPRHFYEGKEVRKVLSSQLLGSGPYRIKEVESGRRIELERNKHFWGGSLEQNLGRYNFDRVLFHVNPNTDSLHELFKRGETDFHYYMSSRQWATETDSLPFQRHYIEKLKVQNSREFGAMAIAWNLRRPLFQDARVRRALSHLMPRDRWIHDLFYDQYVPATGIVGVSSPNHSKANVGIAYNPRQAVKLLNAAGWKIAESGKRKKEGRIFRFEVVSDTPALEKVLTLYQEELAKVGIEMQIRNVEWALGMKLLDDRQFDAYPVSRSREVEPGNFAAEWGSANAGIAGSQNLTGYRNQKVDQLALAIDTAIDPMKRRRKIQELDEIIARDQPMSWCWEPTYFRIGYWNRVSFPGKGYFPYSYWTNVFHYWWWDADKAAKLKNPLIATF